MAEPFTPPPLSSEERPAFVPPPVSSEERPVIPRSKVAITAAQGLLGEFAGGVGDVLGGLWNTITNPPAEITEHMRKGEYGQALKSAIEQSIPGYTLVVKPQLNQFGQAYDYARAGRPLEATGHAIAGVVPVLGPLAADITETAAGEPQMPPGQQVGPVRMPQPVRAAGQAATYAVLPKVAEGVPPAAKWAIERGGPPLRAGFKAGAPDVGIGTAKVAAAGAIDWMLPELPAHMKYAIPGVTAGAGTYQILRGLGKGGKAFWKELRSPAAAEEAAAAEPAPAAQEAPPAEPAEDTEILNGLARMGGYKTYEDAPADIQDKIRRAAANVGKNVKPDTDTPTAPPDSGRGGAAPPAEPPGEPPAGGGGAAVSPEAPARPRTAADEMQAYLAQERARKAAAAQQPTESAPVPHEDSGKPQTSKEILLEGFKNRVRAARQPAVKQFGDWLAGQGYTADMADAISEGTPQNLERWRMMAMQARTDTPTPSGFRDVVNYLRAQEAAPTQPAPAAAAPEPPPVVLNDIVAAEAARRAEAARATAEAMRLMRDRPYRY